MIAYLNEATNIRPMSEFKNYIRKVYIAGERINISSVVDYVNESDEIFHSVFGIKFPFCAFGDGIVFSFGRFDKTNSNLFFLEVHLVVNNGDELLNAYSGLVGLYRYDEMFKKGIQKAVKTIEAKMRKVASIRWDEKEPLKCVQEAARALKSIPLKQINDPLRIFDEAVSVRSVKYLDSYMKKNYPPGEWVGSPFQMSGTGLFSVLKNTLNDDLSFFYPDGKPGDWFILDNMIFVSGTLHAPDRDICNIRLYEIRPEKKQIVFSAIYHIFGYEGKEEAKHVSAAVRRVMKRTASFSRWEEADEFILSAARAWNAERRNA